MGAPADFSGAIRANVLRRYVIGFQGEVERSQPRRGNFESRLARLPRRPQGPIRVISASQKGRWFRRHELADNPLLRLRNDDGSMAAEGAEGQQRHMCCSRSEAASRLSVPAWRPGARQYLDGAFAFDDLPVTKRKLVVGLASKGRTHGIGDDVDFGEQWNTLVPVVCESPPACVTDGLRGGQHREFCQQPFPADSAVPVGSH